MTLFQKDFEVIVLFIEHKYITGFLVFYWKLLGHQNCSVLLSLLLLFPHVNIENLSTIFSWLTPSHKD